MKMLVFIAAIAVVGCSSFGADKVAALNSAIQQGRCSDAAAIANQTDDAVKYNNLGVVAQNCERNPVKARSYYEYGARLGDETAISNLLRMGLPVPIADIKAQNDAAVANTLMLMQAAQPKVLVLPALQPVLVK